MDEMATRILESYLASWWAGHSRPVAKEAAAYLAARFAKARGLLQPPVATVAPVASPHFGAEGAIINAQSILAQKVDRLTTAVNNVLTVVQTTQKGVTRMSTATDDLSQKVASLDATVQKVVGAIGTLKQQNVGYQATIATQATQLTAAGLDATTLQQLGAKIDADIADLAGAMPPAPAPEPAAPPAP